MSIIQISKIQQRSGNIVDLPQLDEAEFGWASDTKQLFIGKTTPNENIEVLTSYSQINFDQINGSVGNLNISNITVADGQVLAYDGNNWVNRGGSAGGLINLGEVSNVKLSGGAIGYVLETDGLGNLSWTPKSSIISFIQNVTKANPAVVTTAQDNFLTDGLRITITNAQGMTQLNGNSYYANVLTSNTFALYSDAGLTTTVNTTGGGFTAYSFTSAASTTASTNVITVGDSSVFSLNQEVEFLGGLGNSSLENNTPYYIKTKPSGTTITVSEELLPNGTAGTVKSLVTETLTSANVYATGGRVIATVSGGSSTAAQGSEGSVQYYASGLLQGDADFVWDANATPKTLTATGNISTGNVNATGVITAPQLISNIATGTAPLTVTSTTRVANLNVASSGTANTVTTNAQPNITSVGTLTSLAVSGTSGITSTDSSGAASTTKIITAINGTRDLSLIPRAGSGSYNTLTAADDALITFANSSAQGNANLTIAPWASANTGIRIQSVSNTATIFLNATNTNVSAALNVSGVITGDGSGISAINASNLSSGTVPTARMSGSYAISVTSAGTVTTAAQPNITSVGTLTSLDVSGNVTASRLISNVATGTAPLTVTSTTRVANLNVATAGAADSATAATNASALLQNTSSATTVYPTFSTSSANGNSSAVFNTSISANLANASITATTFVGALSGAATTAGSATTAGTVTTAAQPNITSVGTLTSVAVTGNVTAGNVYANTGTIGAASVLTPALTTGANTTAGTITGNWTLTTGSRMQATYADLAEYYEADDIYVPGTVVMFGGEKEITLAEDGTSRVAGVVSTNPAYVMNSTCPGLLTAIALQGRVPCKVRGKISKGDMLISGGNGFARPNQFPSMGTVIGKALQDFDGYEGVIEVAVGRL